MPLVRTGSTRRVTGIAREGSPKVTCASLPAEVQTSATPTTRSPNSSGRPSASAMTVMPPMEWPTSTTGPVGTTSSSTRPRSRPSWSIGRALGGPAAAAPVRALVVQHDPDVAGRLQRLPLVVPDGHLLHVAVDQHDGEVGVRRADLLDVQPHAVLRHDGARPVGDQAEERLGGLGVRSQAGPADDVALGGEPDRRAGREHAEQRTDQARRRLHECTRGTRAPIRVTIS
jgi:hypothetical protein